MASTPITGVTSSSPAPGVRSMQSVPSPVAASPDSADDAVSVELFPSSPPDDVMAAIATASASYDALAEQGLHVSFGDGAAGFGASLQDQDGTELSTLKPSEVIALAEGSAPTQARTSDVDDQPRDELDRD